MNNSTRQSQVHSPTGGSVCGVVLSRIEREQLQPHSRLYFQSKECFIWTAWFIALLIGAVAVAVTLYVSTSVPYTLYEATHNNLLTAFVSALPYIWVVIFILTAYLAIVNFRFTKRGYRYQVYTVLLGSVAFSLFAGTAFHYFGGGYALDQALGDMIAAYPSYEKQQYALWQAPEQGRLIGTLLPYENGTSTDSGDTAQEFAFADAAEGVWEIDVSELREQDIALLHEAGEQEVRLMGTSTETGTFKVCGVFPWHTGQALTRQQLDQNRQAFINVVRTHYDAVSSSGEPVGALTDETEAVLGGEEPEAVASSGTQERICAEIAALRRSEHLLAP